MIQNWKKEGLIFTNGDNYTQVPTILDRKDGTWRIFFSERDESNRSRISYIDVEKENPSNIIKECEAPILGSGDIGTFDAGGTMPSCIIRHKDKIYLYYIGWTARKDVSYHNLTGLAASYDDGDTFTKLYKGPILAATKDEPYFIGAVHLFPEKHYYKCWYMSSTGWITHNQKTEPIYHIKYAEAYDGINWYRNGHVAIELEDDEGGLTRPFVIHDKDKYKMWYCYRKQIDYRTNKDNSYRIGYAESSGGKYWKRKDELVNLQPSDSGWDEMMLCYPCITTFKDKLYMFYNGNVFGKSGIGYATLEL